MVSIQKVKRKKKAGQYRDMAQSAPPPHPINIIKVYFTLIRWGLNKFCSAVGVCEHGNRRLRWKEENYWTRKRICSTWIHLTDVLYAPIESTWLMYRMHQNNTVDRIFTILGLGRTRQNRLDLYVFGTITLQP